MITSEEIEQIRKTVKKSFNIRDYNGVICGILISGIVITMTFYLIKVFQ